MKDQKPWRGSSCKGMFIKDVRTKLQKIDPPSPHVRKMSAMTKPPPSPLSMRTQKCTFYAWFTLARKTENGIKQSAIFRRGKS